MKKLFCSFIIAFFASLVLWAQEPIEEDDVEESMPIEKVFPPLTPVESPIPKPTIIQPEVPEEKPEEKISRELPGLTPVDPPEQIPEPKKPFQEFPSLAPVTSPEVVPVPQRQIQQFPALSPVTPPEQRIEAQRQTQEFPDLSPVAPPEQRGEAQRPIQQFPSLSPVSPPQDIAEPQRQIQEFPALSPVTAPTSHSPGNPGHLAYAKQPFSNLLSVGAPRSVYNSFRLSDFSGGLNTTDFPTEIENNEVTDLVNFVWEGKRLKSRKGFAKYNASEFHVGFRIHGLYAYYMQTIGPWGGQKVLLAGTNGKLAGDTIGTGPTFWVKEGLQSNDKYYYFDTFKDKAIVAHEDDYPFAYDGETTFEVGVLDSIVIENIGLACSDPALICTTIFDIDEYVFPPAWDDNQYAGCILSNTKDYRSAPYTFRIAEHDNDFIRTFYFHPEGATLSGLEDTLIGNVLYIWGLYSWLPIDTIVVYETQRWLCVLQPPADTSCWGVRGDTAQGINCTADWYTRKNYTVHLLGVSEGRMIDSSWCSNDTFFFGLDEPLSDYYTNDTVEIRQQIFYRPSIVKVYKNRLFFVHDENYSNVVFFSENNSFGFLKDNYFTLKTADADRITALATFYDDQLGYKDQSKDCLVIFKENSTWKLIWNSATDYYLVQVVDGIGCVAPQSVVNVEGRYLLFRHTTGFYAFDGRTVTPASRLIEPLLDTLLNQEEVDIMSAGYYDHHYYVSYPEKDSTQNTRGLVFNTDLGIWGKTENLGGTLFAQQNAISDTVKLLFADRRTKSLIYQFGKVAADTGQPISLVLKSKSFNLGDLHKRKRFTYFDMDYYLNADSVNVYFYTDFGDSLRYNTKSVEYGGNRHIRIPLDKDCLGRNFCFKLTSDNKFELGAVSFKFREMGE